MRKARILLLIIGILSLTLVFLTLEINNITSFTPISEQEEIDSTQIYDDSCAYFLNQAVKFTLDTLQGMEIYKKEKEKELTDCYQENIQLIKDLEAKKKIPNWKAKYIESNKRFKEVEKENINLISENYILKNTKPDTVKIYVGTSGKYLEWKDTLYYDDKNNTMVNIKVPYQFNYYKNGELYTSDDIKGELIYGEPIDFKVKQNISLQTIITEKDDELYTEVKTNHPDVIIHNEGTVFGVDKRSIKKLIRKIDPDSKIFDVTK